MKNLFDQFWSVINEGAETPAWSNASYDESTMEIQEALNQLGADLLPLVDGKYGPATEVAIRHFQSVASIPIDGVAGPVTWAALRLRLGTTRG